MPSHLVWISPAGLTSAGTTRGKAASKSHDEDDPCVENGEGEPKRAEVVERILREWGVRLTLSRRGRVLRLLYHCRHVVDLGHDVLRRRRKLGACQLHGVCEPVGRLDRFCSRLVGVP